MEKASGCIVAIVVLLAGFLVGLPWVGPLILSVAGAVLVLGKRD